MNVYRHAAVSFAAGALLFIIFRKLQMSIACFLSGVLIDLDHIFDYYMNHELRSKLGYLIAPRKFFKFLSSDYSKNESCYKVYKPLHSVELLIFVLFLFIFRVWSDVATGALVGFLIHIVMDILPLGHIGFASMIYKINKGFPRGADIVRQRLSKIGKDLDKCQLCGATGETILHKRRYWYAGFTRRGLSKFMVLCPNCHDRMHDEEDWNI
jgi:hypothetical protein